MRSRTAVGLAEKVAFLQQPGSYPEATGSVRWIETHMAWVFLTDRHAYKLKKPVRFAFADLRTIEARQRSCRAEVRLNRRLARDVYLGTVPLVTGADGTLRLGGGGERIDWLVKMRRLPAERMLDHALAHGTVRVEAIRTVVRVLAQFYQHAAPVTMGEKAYRRRFERGIRLNRRVLLTPAYALPPALVERTASAQLSWLRREPALLAQRTRRIVDAHGDLRPEHICLEPEPVVIDCLEFDRAYRLLDPADELAFLSLECERLGHPWVESLVFETYEEVTGDVPPAQLVRFYKAYRACVRARLAIWHLDDGDVRTPTRWRRLAETYLRLANHVLPRS